MKPEQESAYILYHRKFRQRPRFLTYDAPLEAWREFDRLMLMAIERGTPLTKAECHAVHNFDDLPPGVVI